MKKSIAFIALLMMLSEMAFSQENPLGRLDFIIGDWVGTGAGFGNEKSKIVSGFHFIMEGKYIEVINESRFDPTEKKPMGEYHIDKGFISFDKIRNLVIFRQFNNEGYINQYVLNDSLSNVTILIFETETIENFAPGGKAKWTIKKINENQIETIFDVSFPGKEYSCFGINQLIKKQE